MLRFTTEFLIRNVTFPVWLAYDGDLRTLRYLREYGNDRWCRTTEHLYERQWERLRALLIHAYENTGYYRQIFDVAGLNPWALSDPAQLASLPILTKATIRQNWRDMLAKNIPESQLGKAQTGGSTGEPLVFYRDRECIRKRRAAALYFDRWMGYDLGRKIGMFVAPPHYPGGASRWKQGIRNATSDRVLAFDPNRTDDPYMRGFYAQLKAFQPDLIQCFPNSLAIFVDFLQRNDLSGIQPRAVSCTGETLFPDQRRTFEDAFRAPVFEKYASFEHGVLACECRAHDGLHIFTDNGWVEFICDGRPARPGEIAELVVTDLTNFGMPFVRYTIGDFAIPSDRSCPCGSALPLVERVLGRDRDILVAVDGTRRPGYLFVEVINKNSLPGQFQVVQTGPKHVDVRYVPGDTFSRAHEELIQREFKRLLGASVVVRLQRVDAIPRDGSGKYAYVKCEIPPLDRSAGRVL